MDGGREVGELKGCWGGEPEPGPHLPCKSWGQRGNQAGKLYNPHFQRNTVSPLTLGKRGLKRLFTLPEFCFVLFFKSGSLEKALQANRMHFLKVRWGREGVLRKEF